MKNYLLLLFVLLSCLSAVGQSWSCIVPGAKRFFINDRNYLRGIRVDFVDTSPDSTVYHFFRTTRFKAYYGYHGDLDTNGACWMGRTATAYNGGVWRFQNIWGNDMAIRAQSPVGSSWIFYMDTSDVYYIATVISAAEQLVEGVLDSVKKIRITAWSQSLGSAVPDPSAGLRIAISKNHGFTEIFDLYMFPHRRVASLPSSPSPGDTIDYFSVICGGQQFVQTDFTYPSGNDIYGYGVGDVLQYTHFDEGLYTAAGHGIYTRIIDTVVSKSMLPDASLSFIVERRLYRQGDDPVPSFHYYGDTSYQTAPGCPFDTTRMPEETGINQLLYYYPESGFPCIAGPSYRIVSGSLFDMFEACGYTEVYKKGYGEIYEGNCDEDRDHFHVELMFSVVNGVQCGSYTPVPVGVEDVLQEKMNVNVLPNPANNVLNIVVPSAGAFHVVLTNAIGGVVTEQRGSGSSVSVNTEAVVPGIYLLTITDENGSRYSRRISVLH